MDVNHWLNFETHLRNEASLPVADESRIHKPIRVLTHPGIIRLFEEMQFNQQESGPWENFYVSMTDASDFPYAGGRKSTVYCYTDNRSGKPAVACMDLSAILKFRTHDHLRIFWIIPVADEKNNWFHIYSNSVWRDARICREFLQRLEQISPSIVKAMNTMSEVAVY